jgi:hypothetical protein
MFIHLNEKLINLSIKKSIKICKKNVNRFEKHIKYSRWLFIRQYLLGKHTFNVF